MCRHLPRAVSGVPSADGAGRDGILPSATPNPAGTRGRRVLISWFTGVHLHDHGCSLKAYRREILREVHLYGEMHRFMPALAHWAGGSIAEVEVAHRPHRWGQSKYGLSRITRVFLDLLTVKFLMSCATRPIQVFGRWGLVIGSIGVVIALVLTVEKLIYGLDIGTRPALLLAILLTLLAGNVITLGLLAELQARTCYETQRKRICTVRRVAPTWPRN